MKTLVVLYRPYDQSLNFVRQPHKRIRDAGTKLTSKGSIRVHYNKGIFLD